MAIKVTKIGEIVGNDIFLCLSSVHRPGDIIGFLTNLEPYAGEDIAINWKVDVMIGKGPSARSIRVDVPAPFGEKQYATSKLEPVLMESMIQVPAPRDVPSGSSPGPLVVFFRDRILASERQPRSGSEREEIILRAKKIVYDEDSELSTLQSYVGNIEAAIEFQRSGPRREPIPDDVKVLVWTRDGGACIRCGSKESLHFDHVIPVVKGGGGTAENIQLLCQTCNLRKSDKIAF